MSSRGRGKRRIRWGRVFFAVFLAVVLASAASMYGYYRLENYRMEHGGKTTVIAIIGIDQREGLDSVRSDVMMLAYVDFEDSKIDLISLPRDSYVSIPCENGAMDKITHAYFYGGMDGGDEGARECALGAMQNALSLPEIHDYAVVDFDSLINMVDDLGGITLTPNNTFCQGIEAGGTYCFEEGVPQELDGKAALAYSRHRYSDSDIYRTARQQQVILAMIDKIKALGVSDMMSFADKALQLIDTDIDAFQAMTYYKLVQREDFTLNRITGEGEDYYDENGVYYFKLDPDWVAEMNAELTR